MKGPYLEAFVLMLATGAMQACAPRAHMCTASTECADKNACVAGRCQLDKPTVKPAVETARRLVVRPVDLAVIANGDHPSNGALPPVFALGRESTKLLLRFSVALPSNANVVEAYVVLRRSTIVDDEPAPISLHATRIEEAWVGGSVSWAMQPRMGEARCPSTTVEADGSPIVRMDVREIVKHWSKHDPTDQGVAIIAENETRSGTTFALSANGVDRDVEPYLEALRAIGNKKRKRSQKNEKELKVRERDTSNTEQSPRSDAAATPPLDDLSCPIRESE